VRLARQGNPIPYTLEMQSAELGRHYAVLYQETKGSYRQRLPQTPDGQWFLDDLITGQRLGVYSGQELRETGLDVTFLQGYSPLKIIRMMPVGQTGADWLNKYRAPADK